MELSDYRSAVLRRIGRSSDDALFATATLTSLVNSAIRTIESEGDWAWAEDTETIALVAGDDTYAPAEDWERTRYLQHSTGEPLERKPSEDVRRLVASGKPIIYTIDSEELMVRPTPSASTLGNLVHAYVKAETPLALDADEPLIPDRWSELVIEYAAFLAFRREGSNTDAAIAKAAYDDLLAQAKRTAFRNTGAAEVGGGEQPVDVA